MATRRYGLRTRNSWYYVEYNTGMLGRGFRIFYEDKPFSIVGLIGEKMKDSTDSLMQAFKGWDTNKIKDQNDPDHIQDIKFVHTINEFIGKRIVAAKNKNDLKKNTIITSDVTEAVEFK